MQIIAPDIIAILVACGFTVAVYLLGADPMLLLAATPVIIALSIWVVITDWRDLIIPDGAVIAIGLVGAALRISAASARNGSTLAGGLVAAFDGVLWGAALLLIREVYFRRRKHDGIGLGDVKLAAAYAVLVTASAFAWSLLLASVAAIASVWFAGFRHGREPKKIPFGAFLAPACCLTWIVQTWV